MTISHAFPAPRAHADIEWQGDRPGQLAVWAKAGHKYADQNFHAVWRKLDVEIRHAADGDFAVVVFGIHSPTPAQNNFSHVVDERTGRTRPMTHAELHGKVNEFWDAAGVYRWRRLLDDGTYERPHTLRTHLEAAKAAGICLVPELKNPVFAHEAVMRQVAAIFAKVGARPVVMALYELPACEGKCAAAIACRIQFLVIYGNDPHHHTRDAARIHIATTWATKPTWN